MAVITRCAHIAAFTALPRIFEQMELASMPEALGRDPVFFHEIALLITDTSDWCETEASPG